ncbi:hypothetical protein ACFFX0_18525 [Citricoccus parietis]|uniref:Uncharacterized protein n=1 Tax=Citricoccus parietis TaxID=592307 RepID=A0ABV5G2E9_9MICC
MTRIFSGPWPRWPTDERRREHVHCSQDRHRTRHGPDHLLHLRGAALLPDRDRPDTQGTRRDP